MPTTNDYLNSLKNDKSVLVQNLNAKRVEDSNLTYEETKGKIEKYGKM